jgi:flagellar hook-associated protein 1 FlgK
MGILTTLLNSSSAMQVYEKEFATIQNNIANQDTPGYAEQNQTLVADAFDPSAGLEGGLSAGPMLSTRSPYLEQVVRTQTSLLGSAEQQASDLTPLQSQFDLTSATGVSGSLDSFFNSFSALSVSPNDAGARQTVLTQAQTIASAFNSTASGINSVSNNVEQETGDSVSTINQIAGDLANINKQYGESPNASSDAGLDAQVNSDLENLSEVANFTVVPTTNGQFNVYLGGQTPIVMGAQSYNVSANFSTPQTVIQDSQGNDITSQITGGQLGAQIQENNVTLPGYSSTLNTLAQTFADSVNNVLSQGVDQSGNSPVNNMFTYTAGNAAFTLSVTPGFTTDQIAAALPAAPGGNGNALVLAQLASAPAVNGMTFTQAFGTLGQQVGTDISNATNNQTAQQNLVTQAQAQRTAVSGVSLDTEAAKLLQFQQSYEAVAKVVSTLNSLTDSLMAMMPLAG